MAQASKNCERVIPGINILLTPGKYIPGNSETVEFDIEEPDTEALMSEFCEKLLKTRTIEYRIKSTRFMNKKSVSEYFFFNKN